jgi:hypothetical protein
MHQIRAYPTPVVALKEPLQAAMSVVNKEMGA